MLELLRTNENLKGPFFVSIIVSLGLPFAKGMNASRMTPRTAPIEQVARTGIRNHCS